jgi:hypothetical protein
MRSMLGSWTTASSSSKALPGRGEAGHAGGVCQPGEERRHLPARDLAARVERGGAAPLRDTGVGERVDRLARLGRQAAEVAEARVGGVPLHAGLAPRR